MTIRLAARILAAALLFGVGIRVSPAQAQGAGLSISESESAPPESSSPSSTSATPEINQATETPAETRNGLGLPGRFLLDQKEIWTSPAKIRWADARWILPLAGLSATLFATEASISKPQSNTPVTIQRYKTISTAGVGALAGVAGGMWLLSYRPHGFSDGEHWRETGFLAGESALNSLVMVETLKYSLRRQRPFEGGGSGPFFQSGGTSFPSEHAAAAWSIAGVVAHEYPGPLTKITAYGLAALVSFSRVRASQHFPSDVLIGSLAGYMISQNIYSRRTRTEPRGEEPGGADWPSFSEMFRSGEDLSIASMGSTYVPLDSWVYPAVERLGALGVVRDDLLGLRPWTRLAVSRMLEDVDDEELDTSAAVLVRSLQAEFTREAKLDAGKPNQAISLDQVYSRVQFISGRPLNDGLHFGQTIANDFGRPYGQGWQQINGFETRAEQGRFSCFVRGEYQHSPSLPGYSANVAQVIATQDNTPVQSFNGRAALNSFRLLDTYVSMHLLGQEFSVGKQSYWWGPDDGSAMMLSDNAEPFYSLRIKRATPLYIPLLSKLLGPFQYDNFFGKLSGHKFPRQPFFYGQKISFSPTKNLELGFSRDAVIAGEGVAPLTFGTFWHSFTSTSSGTCAGCSLRNNPGARHGSFDFRYRLPGLRNWLTLYADSVVHDDVSPVDAPRHAAMTPGIYLAKVPGLPKLDLHVEGGSTDITHRAEGGKYYFYEGVYRDGYTNKGYLLSSWLGREGTGGQAWATYWLTPESTIQFGYRTLKVSPHFVPQGESQLDGYARLRYGWRNGLGLQVLIQGERWRAPVLMATPQVDVTTQIQVSFSPKSWSLSKR